jgi:hypothetical protein
LYVVAASALSGPTMSVLVVLGLLCMVVEDVGKAATVLHTRLL